MNPVQNRWLSVRDHRRQFAEYLFVYPVISRRSRGLSIGINLNPDKLCNFNCVYCEVDRRTPGRADQVDLNRLGAELTDLLRFVKSGGLSEDPRFAEAPDLIREIKDLAFSGDGEPTMIPNFAACVQIVAQIKQTENLPATKIVLITNAAGLDKTDVKRGLELMDANQGEIWGKLDAGTEAYFQQVNRTPVRFERILANLLATARQRPIVIQSLFFQLKGQTMPEPELRAYCHRLNDLINNGAQIKEVHAYTIARPTPETWATRLTDADLSRIANRIRAETGLTVLEFA